jgi:hypothetical protein
MTGQMKMLSLWYAVIPKESGIIMKPMMLALRKHGQKNIKFKTIVEKKT